MRIGLVQTRPVFGDVDGNLKRALSAAGKLECDLVVLPECFATGYLFLSRTEAARFAEPAQGGRIIGAVRDFAGKTGCWVVGGFAEKAGAKLYNSAFLIGPEGMAGVYRKLHLYGGENKLFDPGNRPPRVWDIGKCRVGILICFDWIFPETARVLALAGADVLCHPANLLLQYCQDAMVTRSIENHVFSITANRIGADERGGKKLSFTGRSRIVSPWGEVLAQAPSASPEALAVEIDPALARNKAITPRNDLLGDRRPRMYKGLC